MTLLQKFDKIVTSKISIMTETDIQSNQQQQQQQKQSDLLQKKQQQQLSRPSSLTFSKKYMKQSCSSSISSNGNGSNSNGNNNNSSGGSRSSMSVWRTVNKIALKDDEHMQSKFQNRIDKMYPPAYSSNIRPEQEVMLQQCKDAMEWAVVFPDSSHILTALSTLKSYCILKYPLSKDDAELFISNLYTILIDHCKMIPLTTSVCAYLFALLRDARQQVDIIIEWRPLFNLFKEVYNIPERESTFIHVNETDISKLKTNLNELIATSRPFFSVDSFKEIQDEVHDWFCPHAISIFHGVYVLAYFLPTHHLVELREVPSWVNLYFTFWEYVENNADWDERWLYVFLRVVKHATAVDWRPVASRIYTHFIRVIDLSIGNPKFAHLKPTKHNIPASVKIAHEECLEYTFMGATVIALLRHDTMDLFKKLMSSISTYYHPSNHGEWTMPILEFLSSICHAFVKNHLKKPFPAETLNQFLETIFPIVLLTLYSKNKNYTLNACKILKELAYISPRTILPSILDRLYGSVNSEELNRLISELEVVSTCFHPLISQTEQFPEGISHVYNLMELVMNSMDPTYPNKSSAAFKFIYRIFTCIPLNDETVYTDQETFSNEYEKQASLSTASFLDWSLLLLDKLLVFIKNSAVKKDVSGHKRKMPSGTFLGENIDLFFNQMSDEIYDAVLEKLAHFFSKSYYPDYYKQYSLLLKSATLRNPSKSLATFLPIFIKKIFKYSAHDDKYMIRDLTDEEYGWYISLIGYTVFKSGNAMPEHKDTLIRICKVMMASDNRLIVKHVSKIIRKAIYSLTRYYPSNNTSIPISLLSEQKSHIKYWGKTNEDCFPLEWFQPTENTIQMSKELIQIFVKDRSKELLDYVNEINKDNSLFNRVKLLNYAKSFSSIMRTTIFLLNDDVLDPNRTVDDCKYNPTQRTVSHGRVVIPEFDGLVVDIYQTFNQLQTLLESKKSDEVHILKYIAKTYSALGFGVRDIPDRNSDVLFSKWRNLKKLKSRNYIVFKAYKAHLQRQTNNYANIPVSKVCRDILFDLKSLSLHRYKEVRKIAQDSILSIVRHHPGAQNVIVGDLVNTYIEQKSDEEVCGTVHLLLAKQFLKTIKTNFSYFVRLASSFMAPCDPKFKTNTRHYILHFKQEFVLSKIETLIHRPHTQLMLGHVENHTIVPSEIIAKQKAFIDEKNSENYELLKTFSEKICDCFTQRKDTMTWRDHLILQSYLTYAMSTFIKQLGRDSNMKLAENVSKFRNDVQIFLGAYDRIFNNMNSDYPISRILSVNIISLFQIQDSTFGHKAYDDFWLKPVKSSAPPKLDIPELAAKVVFSLMATRIKTIVTPTFLDKLLKYFCVDNDSEGQNVGLGLSTKTITPLWPSTRHGIPSNCFKIQYARLFFELVSVMGDSFYDMIKPHIEALRKKNDKEEQYLLSEIISGLARFYTVTPDQPKSKEAISYISEVLLNALKNCSNDLNDTWGICIRYIAFNTKVERVQWLSDTLFKLYENPLNIFSQSKSIKFLKALLFEFTFKSKDYLDRLLLISHKGLSDPYKQIRDENYRLFTHVLVYLVEYQEKNGDIITLTPPKLPVEAVDCINSIVADATNEELPIETRTIIKESLISVIEFTFSKGYSNALLRMVPTLLPKILQFTADTNQEIMKNSMICVASMAQGFYYDHNLITEILAKIKDLKTSSWRVRRSILPFLQILYFNHSNFFTPEQSDTVYSIVIQSTGDSQIEVREFAKDTLASILMSSRGHTDRIRNLISNAIAELGSSKATSENVLQKHKSILILSAIILSSPYQIPSYFPEILGVLARYRSSIQPLRDTVQSVLSDFWRTHKDTWEEEKLSFSEEQIELIHDTVAYPSYYA
ncbi:proteasome activator complex subunit 4 [Heterostelium album PN500]|uniref:Proteasome activator complex subunit 4 n=1 Tax=Heterostelium pallidum (strain ATCC 26659 / Pp 5 / PN500) TaxID=670386 RepID=D3BCD7_HETP5|nr:proteasome activator complex subunit 4 [Heterostelium album PN500]EFA80927.1 proteasome activator complex subunit 4 [Heterostelium album PN500]|eukprot:XP_020433045.1 proteasome activator complex subunit 4 [Heterostelium album PN500]